jgi:hypothetical protein
MTATSNSSAVPELTSSLRKEIRLLLFNTPLSTLAFGPYCSFIGVRVSTTPMVTGFSVKSVCDVPRHGDVQLRRRGG